MIPAEAVERFRADLEQLTDGPPELFGVAVSGGPDSLALLLLAAAAYPGAVVAATVDHGLRADSSGEAQNVAQICSAMGIEHNILRLDWTAPGSNIQARAREERYNALGAWATDRGVRVAATAHHLDDQAETLLMRLARGSGVAGLAGTRPIHPVPDEHCKHIAYFVRPLLAWRKHELADIVAAAGLEAVDDSSNHDARFDRSRARAFLANVEWLRAERLAATASHLKDAEIALGWMAAKLLSERRGRDRRDRLTIDVDDLPRELQRRILAYGVGLTGASGDFRGPKLARLLDQLRMGRSGTLAGVKVVPGPPWTFAPAPPRKS